MERQLVTIRTVTDIRPIENADSIVACQLDYGWVVVARKDEYQVGEKACYLEIDSWVPTELAPFLSKGKDPREYNGIRGERLKTVKLRGQISQGLILKLDMVPQIMDQPEDIDLATILGVIKWEPPSDNSGGPNRSKPRGNFPYWLWKSDQERCQNFWNKIPRDIDMEVSVKLDGSSATYFYNANCLHVDEPRFGVCSRNLELKPPETEEFDPWWEMAFKYDLETKLKNLGRNIALQGEVIGVKMNGNWEKLEDRQLFIYNAFDIDNQRWLPSAERVALCNELGLQHVPILEFRKFDFANIEEALAYAEGPSIRNKTREGVVFKAVDGSFSCKIISNLFLLKKDS